MRREIGQGEEGYQGKEREGEPRKESREELEEAGAENDGENREMDGGVERKRRQEGDEDRG